jgi:hypothetical protein
MNTCPGIKDTIELTDDIKEHILSNRIYKMNAPSDNKKIAKMEMELAILKKQYNESFFQKIVESYLGGGHKTLCNGMITDVTTDTIHAEIKVWDDYLRGISQLQAYNLHCPREKLQLYFFGKYSKKCQDNAIKTVKGLLPSCEIYVFDIVGSVVHIKDYGSDNVVYEIDIST